MIIYTYQNTTYLSYSIFYHVMLLPVTSYHFQSAKFNK